MKRALSLLLTVILVGLALSALAETNGADAGAAALPDGIYSVLFSTDSSMFRINEALNGRGTLTVTDGRMTLHITLQSKKILNLYPGLAEDAKKEGAVLLEPTLDPVTYADGYTENVYGFDIPVPVLEEAFDLALIGTKGKWYDHKVVVSDPILIEELPSDGQEGNPGETIAPDGFSFSGGTGRVTLSCPEVYLDGEQAQALIVFSSPRYTYVKADGTEYPTICDEETSRAVIPVPLNRSFEIQAQTTAMSEPHEITYTLYIRMDALSEDGLPGLKWESTMPLRYAEGFQVDYFQGGYALIRIREGGRYLVVPEGLDAPEGLDPEITVLRRPLKRIYLAATSAMSLFDAMDGLDAIRFSSLQAEDWSVAAAADAMERGEILFAGKYDQPDYESLVREGCDLAVESTMILHAPKIQELLELLHIPVLVDRSSYEPHPLGRTEWIKLYAVLLGKEADAERFFAEQEATLSDYEDTGKTVAFFYLSSNGTVVVRSPADYIPRMISMAGGTYALQDLPDDGQAAASVGISMEEFYTRAVDADILIYNAAIDTTVGSLQDLTGRAEVLSEFKAVKEGQVWRAERNLYQATDRVAGFIQDIHRILTEDERGAKELMFLRPLE